MPYYKVMAKFKGYPPRRETWGIFKANDPASAIKKGKADCKKLRKGRNADLGTQWKAIKTKEQTLKELKKHYYTINT